MLRRALPFIEPAPGDSEMRIAFDVEHLAGRVTRRMTMLCGVEEQLCQIFPRVQPMESSKVICRRER
jgi:hypothetical protein